MPQYLLSVHTAENAPRPAMTDEDARRGFELIGALEAQMTAAEALVFSARLSDTSSARVVNAQNGTVVTTDGPYVEAKESIGGFYIVEAEDLDAALNWAGKTSAAIQMPIEVRPFIDSKRP
ncbi:MAG: YciI family protein [Candidatus Limnocylindria bacterium]